MISWRNTKSPALAPSVSFGLLTTKQVAALIGVTEARVQVWGANGTLQRMGRSKFSHLYSREEVEALMRRRREQLDRLRARKRKWRVRV